MASLKEYAVVGFVSAEDAEKAFDVATSRFNIKNRPVHNLSRQDGNIVYMHVVGVKKSIVEDFLLRQPGAQPKGCRFKV